MTKEKSDLKERIADLLRQREGDFYAAKFLHAGNVDLPYGSYVHVFISENIDCTIDVGVNWSALGTVNANKAYAMARHLTRAAELAEAVQDLIDGNRQGEEG